MQPAGRRARLQRRNVEQAELARGLHSDCTALDVDINDDEARAAGEESDVVGRIRCPPRVDLAEIHCRGFEPVRRGWQFGAR